MFCSLIKKIYYTFDKSFLQTFKLKVSSSNILKLQIRFVDSWYFSISKMRFFSSKIIMCQTYSLIILWCKLGVKNDKLFLSHGCAYTSIIRVRGKNSSLTRPLTHAVAMSRSGTSPFYEFLRLFLMIKSSRVKIFIPLTYIFRTFTFFEVFQLNFFRLRKKSFLTGRFLNFDKKSNSSGSKSLKWRWNSLQPIC